MSLRRHIHGFTLIELMATLLVVAVVAAWAVPSFLDMIRGNRAQTQATQIARSLSYARSEAVRRNGRVYITSLKGNNDWGVEGWRVWFDQNNNATYDDGIDLDLQEQAPLVGGATLTAKNSVSEIVFLGSGFVDMALSAGPVTFEYRVSEKCSLGKDIELMPTGRASIPAEAKGC